MKIGIITTGYPHEHSPVPGAFVRAMARAFARRGHTVRVVCVAWHGARTCVDAGIEVVEAPAPWHGAETFFDDGAPDALARGGVGAWLAGAGWTVSIARATRRHLADVDVVVSNFIVPGAMAARALNKRHVAVAHGSDVRLFARLPRRTRAWVLRGIDALWVTHAGLSDVLGAKVPALVAPMGFDPIDAAAREITRNDLGIQDGETLLLGVGRLVALKGFDVIVRASVGAPLRVLVAGDGPERARLERLAADLGAPVRFVGAVEPSRRDAFLAAADVFALPSRRLANGRDESAPVALVEAMGAGLAIVASGTGGVPAVLGGAGLLVPADDVGAWRDALLRLHRDAKLRAELGSRARERASAWHWGALAERVEPLLRGS